MTTPDGNGSRNIDDPGPVALAAALNRTADLHAKWQDQRPQFSLSLCYKYSKRHIA